jgi:hypothetical protein
MRGHSTNIDFSKDNYQSLDTAMLFNFEARVDNTFEYRGGLQKVTEEVFHHTIKSQMKAKRYQMKKLMLDGQEKPHHIRQDHWLNLAKFITEARAIRSREAQAVMFASEEDIFGRTIGRASEDKYGAYSCILCIFLYAHLLSLVSASYAPNQV